MDWQARAEKAEAEVSTLRAQLAARDVARPEVETLRLPVPWRQGGKVPLNVYDAHGTPIAQFHDAETAARVVAAVNLAALSAPTVAGRVRYAVRNSEDGSRLSYTLFRFTPDEAEDEVFCDAMEPEDALLVRDLRSVVDELNRLAGWPNHAIDCRWMRGGFQCSCGAVQTRADEPFAAAPAAQKAELVVCDASGSDPHVNRGDCINPRPAVPRERE